MIIFVSFDSSLSQAPAGFYTAVNAAAEYWERAITNPISVTIVFGWGEVGGQALASNALGESADNGVDLNFTQVRSALVGAAQSATAQQATGDIPTSDPTHGGTFFVADAEALALGQATDGSQVDGFVGMASNSPFTFNPYDRAVPGAFDAIGTMEHEISEVLGRIAGSGQVEGGVAQWDPLDLFRYANPGQLQTSPAAAYFSVDGGQTLGQSYNNPSQGDAGDWTSAAVGDAFGSGHQGIAALVTPVDLQEMNVLGYQIATDANARNDFNANGFSDFLIQNSSGVVVTGQDIHGAATYAATTDLGSEWKFVDDGDFLSSGNDQFLIENASGAIVDGAWFAGKMTFTQVASLGPEWTFHGAGDFLGNGYDDQFLIQNASGVVAVGDAISDTAAYTTLTSLGPEWKFVGVGDYNGDGPSDFLIENTSGSVVVGELKNGSVAFTAVTGLGPEWKFVGSGDFLNDGKDQFLIQNTAGTVDVGEVHGSSVTFTQVTTLGSEWSFVGSGDYTGQGYDAFLIENTSGAVVIGDLVSGHIQFAQVASLGPEWSFH